jgi:hypothetical protein
MSPWRESFVRLDHLLSETMSLERNNGTSRPRPIGWRRRYNFLTQFQVKFSDRRMRRQNNASL